MTRATSKAAFLHMQETGKAATKCRQILAYVEAHPGCSRGDIVRNVPGMTVNCCSGRVRELLDSGALIEHGCAHDPVTGRSVNRLYVNPERMAA